ncbi:MAG TPA: DUF559 domain-containing protein [Acetobacteraceae bacterium]
MGGGWGEGAAGSDAPSSLLTHARRMRHDPTPAEKLIWQRLRNHRLESLKFRRQTPLGPYIVDFYCASARLVVEIDGISHIDAQIDATRDAWMQAQGIRVLRFANFEVFKNLEGILLAIKDAAGSTPPPGPLPQGEGESSFSAPSSSSSPPSSSSPASSPASFHPHV